MGTSALPDIYALAEGLICTHLPEGLWPSASAYAKHECPGITITYRIDTPTPPPTRKCTHTRIHITLYIHWFSISIKCLHSDRSWSTSTTSNRLFVSYSTKIQHNIVTQIHGIVSAWTIKAFKSLLQCNIKIFEYSKY